MRIEGTLELISEDDLLQYASKCFDEDIINGVFIIHKKKYNMQSVAFINDNFPDGDHKLILFG
jgi:hypothetical protein